MARRYVDNAYNRRIGRVGMPVGSCVVSGSSGGSYGGSSGTSGSSRVYVDNARNRALGRVGKPLGSHVEHRDGSVTITSSSGASGISSTYGVYVDNAKNRALGRVGKPLGSHVEHRDGSVTISSLESSASQQRYYVDNPYNRRLSRVGLPIPPRKQYTTRSDRQRMRRHELISEHTIDELLYNLKVMGFGDMNQRSDCQYTVDRLERYQIEETWRRNDINPYTDLSQVRCMGKEIIPYCELEGLGKEPIGRGGFGRVYAGLWKRQPIAFKKVIVQHMPRKKLETFMKEIKIFSSLNHPHIVKMFGAVVEEGNIGIVMEYLTGSLYQAIFMEEINCKFSRDKKKIIIHQVASALEYLHTRDPKIAHCDVKSENILLDKDNSAKLGDFGLSVVKDAAKTSCSNAGAPPGQGTPRYSAPEVLRGEFLSMSQLLMSDIYSLAIVVFELLMKEEPYEYLNLLQLQEHVGRGRRRPTLDSAILTRPVIDILKRSWDVSASQRPTATEFIIEWSQIYTLFNN